MWESALFIVDPTILTIDSLLKIIAGGFTGLVIMIFAIILGVMEWAEQARDELQSLRAEQSGRYLKVAAYLSIKVLQKVRSEVAGDRRISALFVSIVGLGSSTHGQLIPSHQAPQPVIEEQQDISVEEPESLFVQLPHIDCDEMGRTTNDRVECSATQMLRAIRNDRSSYDDSEIRVSMLPGLHARMSAAYQPYVGRSLSVDELAKIATPINRGVSDIYYWKNLRFDNLSGTMDVDVTLRTFFESDVCSEDGQCESASVDEEITFKFDVDDALACQDMRGLIVAEVSDFGSCTIRKITIAPRRH